MAEDSAGPWLIVGLGNPGPQYVGNRHNAGFLALDILSDRTGGTFRRHKTRADAIEGRLAGQRVVLAKPLTFMNDSGGPVAGLLKFYKPGLEQLIVVHDELDLDYGRLRIKLGGGDGGHNGLKSIRRSIGSGDYFRVRFGIGRPPGRQDPADYVLRDFNAAERKNLDLDLERTADAVESLMTNGLEATQNAFHAG